MSKYTTYFQLILSQCVDIRCISEPHALNAADSLQEELFLLKIKSGEDIYLYGYSLLTEKTCDIFRGRTILGAYYFEEFDYHVVAFRSPVRNGKSSSLMLHADFVYDLGENQALKSRYVEVEYAPELKLMLATTLMYATQGGVKEYLKKEVDTL